MRRAMVLLSVALAVAVALTGCGPGREPLETAIPSALVASDLGIESAEASTSLDGLGLELAVYSRFDRDTVTAAELRSLLEIIVANNDAEQLNRVQIGATYGTDDNYEFLDLRDAWSELGVSLIAATENSVEIRWSTLREFLDE